MGMGPIGLARQQQQQPQSQSTTPRTLFTAPAGGPSINAPVQGQPLRGQTTQLGAPRPNSLALANPAPNGRQYTPNYFNQISPSAGSTPSSPQNLNLRLQDIIKALRGRII